MNFHINGFLCDYTEKIIRETDYLIYLIAGAVLILRFFSDTSSVSLISSHYLLLSQVRSKSATSPLQIHSSSNRKNGVTTEAERRHNGGMSLRQLIIEKWWFYLRKNFFAKTLHPYTSTPDNTHILKALQGFQICVNPTPTLHQPYTQTWIFQKFRLIDN